MPELTPEDVEAYTKGRLDPSDGETVRMLTVALNIARREAGWHVCPPRAETMTIDGPDSRILWLPTLKLNTLTSVSELGVTLDLTTLRKSAGDGPGLPRRVALRKRSRGYWTDEYESIVVTMNHGFDEDDAADWRQAVMSMVDQMSLLPVSAATGVSEFGLTGKRVDDVDYRYGAYASMAEEVVFSINNVLDDYRLPSVEYF